MVPFLRDLLAHAEWANAVFFHAWAKSPARDHEELRSRVAHILGVQQGFLAMLRGENHALRAVRAALGLVQAIAVRMADDVSQSFIDRACDRPALRDGESQSFGQAFNRSAHYR